MNLDMHRVMYEPVSALLATSDCAHTSEGPQNLLNDT